MTLVDLRNGDSRQVLKTLPDNSVDAVVTDPPYELGFMSKKWDGSSIAHDPTFWAEVMRVMKPGAHVVAFGGSRTYHRMVCAMEDAGFEIRDSLMWIYGTGFPKSLNVSKAIDEKLGATRPVVGKAPWSQPAKSGHHGGMTGDHVTDDSERYTPDVTAPGSPEAEQWNGWGTALKPAFEPIVLARKPLEGTVAANVLKYGTGGLNIDGCRITTTESLNGGAYAKNATPRHDGSENWRFKRGQILDIDRTPITGFTQPQGRWPANLVHDGSDEVADMFPSSKDGVAVQRNRDGQVHNQIYGAYRKPAAEDVGYGTTGSASRFFYSAKAAASDREEGLSTSGDARKNTHPTVKPTALMQWLIRLVTPPGGTVLDPFMGSGSTGKAAVKDGVPFIGIEMDQTYFDIAKARIEHAAQPPTPVDSLFP